MALTSHKSCDKLVYASKDTRPTKIRLDGCLLFIDCFLNNAYNNVAFTITKHINTKAILFQSRAIQNSSHSVSKKTNIAIPFAMVYAK